MRLQTSFLAVAGVLAGLAAAPVLAGPHGGGASGMGGMSSGALGGQSAGHMSSMGLANTNGLTSADRDFGSDRASDRRNAMAGSHSALTSNGVNGLDRDRGKDRAADRAHRHGHKHAVTAMNTKTH
jgi:hypothetical protein